MQPHRCADEPSGTGEGVVGPWSCGHLPMAVRASWERMPAPGRLKCYKAVPCHLQQNTVPGVPACVHVGQVGVFAVVIEEIDRVPAQPCLCLPNLRDGAKRGSSGSGAGGGGGLRS